MVRLLVNASAIVLLLYALWGFVELARTPRESPGRRIVQLRTRGALLAGASRFVPDVYELPFFMLMIGVVLICLAGAGRRPAATPSTP